LTQVLDENPFAVPIAGMRSIHERAASRVGLELPHGLEVTRPAVVAGGEHDEERGSRSIVP
jgi:hypothetical protein